MKGPLASTPRPSAHENWVSGEQRTQQRQGERVAAAEAGKWIGAEPAGRSLHSVQRGSWEGSETRARAAVTYFPAGEAGPRGSGAETGRVVRTWGRGELL